MTTSDFFHHNYSDSKNANLIINGNKPLYGNGDIPLSEAYKRMGNAMRNNGGEWFANDARGLAQQKNSDNTPKAIPNRKVVKIAPPQVSIPTVAIPTPKLDNVQVASVDVKVPVKLGSSSNNNVPAAQPTILAGQNLSDRQLAHVATGGIGRSDYG